MPSTLGIGLIEGYNEIGFEKSLSKPQLRRETERGMVRVCEGTKSKAEMLTESIEQYREMYVLAKREFDKVVSVGGLFYTGVVPFTLHFRACAGTLNVTRGKIRAVGVVMVVAAVEGVEVVQEGVVVETMVIMMMITITEDPHQEVPVVVAVEDGDEDGALQLQLLEAVDEALLGQPHRHLPMTLTVCIFVL
jgi:hypothetical protein